VPAVVTAIKDKASPSTSVSFKITSNRLREEFSEIISLSSIATGASLTAVTSTVKVPVAVSVPS
jgi:hypothetical protein